MNKETGSNLAIVFLLIWAVMATHNAIQWHATSDAWRKAAETYQVVVETYESMFEGKEEIP